MSKKIAYAIVIIILIGTSLFFANKAGAFGGKKEAQATIADYAKAASLVTNQNPAPAPGITTPTPTTITVKQPAMDARNSTVVGTVLGKTFIDLNVIPVSQNPGDTIWAIYPDVEKATDLANIMLDGEAEVRMVLVEVDNPKSVNGHDINWVIVDHWAKATIEIPKKSYAGKKIAINSPASTKVDPPAVITAKEKPATNNGVTVGKKTGTITPGLISPSDVEVTTTIKVKGKQVSETTTNLGDVVDASAPEPESDVVDAGE